MNAQEYFRDMNRILDLNYLNNIEKNAVYSPAAATIIT